MTSAAEIVRATGVGASEIAAILGISPFADRWQVWAKKKGIIENETTERMYWGTKLEPVIAQVFSERTQLPVEWSNQRIYSKSREWQYSSPDALILTEPRAVLECKTAGLDQAGEWDRDAEDEDGVPEHYWAQVEWQMSTLELDTAYIAVLIAGNDFRYYKIRHDPEFEEMLLEEGYDFWRKHLLGDAEPPIGGSKRARDYLKRRFPREKEKLRAATLDEIVLLDEYARLRGEMEERQDCYDKLENQLKLAIGESEGLTWARGKLTWKKTKDREETDWRKLAESQLAGCSKEERAALIHPYTHPIAGYRRIDFRGAA